MAILQPLYYSGGQFRADYDRKIFAALIGSEADGTRLEGIIGSPSHTDTGMKVTAGGGLSISVQPGFCVIADNAKQYSNYPSLYLAGVDTNSYTFTLSGTSSGTRTDLIYAKFDDTPYTIISASLDATTSVATLVTATAHNFIVGDTVVVSGIDDVFDGAFTAVSGTNGTTIKLSNTTSSSSISTVTYNANIRRLDTNTSGSSGFDTRVVVVDRSFTRDTNSSTGTVTLTTATAHNVSVGNTVRVEGVGAFFDGDYVAYTGTTGTTLKYQKTGSDIASLSSTDNLNNYFAVARVPFSIRQAQDTINLPDTTGIPLAEVTISPTSIISVTDRRKFISANGTVQRFDSSAGPSSNSLQPDHAGGKLAYDTNTDSFYWSDGTNWNQASISTHGHESPVRYYQAPNLAAGGLVKPVSFAYAGPITITGSNYLNEYELVGSSNVSVTAISYAAGVITYTASNTFTAGNPVTITGASSSQYNGTFVVASATSTQFTVSATITAGTTSTATAYRPMGVAISTNDRCYVVVDHAVNISAASGGVSPQVMFDWRQKLPDGTTVTSWLNFTFPTQVYNDGTDYSQGEMQNYHMNALSTAGNVQSSRGLMLTPGTTIITLCAILTNGVSTDSFTVNDMTMRVIPFYEVPA